MPTHRWALRAMPSISSAPTPTSRWRRAQAVQKRLKCISRTGAGMVSRKQGALAWIRKQAADEACQREEHTAGDSNFPGIDIQRPEGEHRHQGHAHDKSEPRPILAEQRM